MHFWPSFTQSSPAQSHRNLSNSMWVFGLPLPSKSAQRSNYPTGSPEGVASVDPLPITSRCSPRRTREEICPPQCKCDAWRHSRCGSIRLNARTGSVDGDDDDGPSDTAAERNAKLAEQNLGLQ